MENCFRMCFQIPTYLLVNPGLPPDIRSIFYYFFHRYNIGIFSAFSSLKLSPYLSACFYLSYWKMLGICSKCTTKYGNVRQCTTMYDNVPLYCHESEDHPSVPLALAAKALITKILCWNWWHVQSPSIKCLDLLLYSINKQAHKIACQVTYYQSY